MLRTIIKRSNMQHNVSRRSVTVMRRSDKCDWNGMQHTAERQMSVQRADCMERVSIHNTVAAQHRSDIVQLVQYHRTCVS